MWESGYVKIKESDEGTQDRWDKSIFKKSVEEDVRISENCRCRKRNALPSCDHKKAAVLAEEACIQESGQVQHYYASL